MSARDSGRSSYLDLLISVLMQHEKNMDRILKKMEKLSQDLIKAEEIKKKDEKGVAVLNEVKVSHEGLDTLIYMKLNLNRSLEEVLKILQSLKE
jgi:mevalonate kinase